MTKVIPLHPKQNGVRLPVHTNVPKLDASTLFKRFAAIGWGLGVEEHSYILVNDLEWTFHLYPEGTHWRVWAETAIEQQAGVEAFRGMLELQHP